MLNRLCDTLPMGKCPAAALTARRRRHRVTVMIPLHLKNLTKRFDTPRGTIVAVDDVSLDIEGGELFFLLGPSGCGKTTLLRMLAGLVEPQAGKIFFGERDVTAVAPERRDAAMVFQSYALWPHMTVAKNVSFGPEVRRRGRTQRRRIVNELLETVRIAEKADAKPMELSGGQQQRVALARALAVRPQCLLLDEPLSNLDATLRGAMRWEIRRIVKSFGTTAVYVTHDQAEALAIADRIAVMKDGRIVQTGTGRELYEAPADRFVAEFLGEANFIEATLGAPARDEGTLLETPLGRLRSARTAPSLATGDRLTCCIRPESLRIVPADTPGGENNFTVRLLEWTHLGNSARFRVAGAGGIELAGAAMPARPVADQGDELTLHVACQDVIILAS